VESSFENSNAHSNNFTRSTPSKFAAHESGVDAKSIEEIARLVSTAGNQTEQSQLAQRHLGRQPRLVRGSRMFMLNALLGAVATEGGVFPNAWNKFVPKADSHAAASEDVGRSELAPGISALDA
jgi:hypothetical protein